MSNRLAGQTSPYLLKHAGNPVDWHPWDHEAFALARRLDRPVFLSIGYTACHWCNVMEQESFSDAQTAALLNSAFVCIKVDREERPDIDHLYMEVCQRMTGSGGWPLTVIMTPERLPFFAATYIPREAAYGRTGLKELVPRITELWHSKREDINALSLRVIDALRDSSPEAEGAGLIPLIDQCQADLAGGYDNEYGGFGMAPKFPTPQLISFLLAYHRLHPGSEALHMAATTLYAMRMGGIYDHIGHGFHRYATDRQWLVPHFEKMLSDQALLMLAYTDAHLMSEELLFRDTARGIATFVLMELTSPEGGFYSSLGADSEGHEGLFYLWGRQDVKDALGPELADKVCKVFGIASEGRRPDAEPSPENIPHLTKPAFEAAKEAGLTIEQWRDMTTLLLEHRRKRPSPELDDKVLTDTSGLMIAAMARGGSGLCIAPYIKAARRAAEFHLSATRPDGKLMHVWCKGRVSVPAMAEDYAFLILGLLELYDATYETRWLSSAVELGNEFVSACWDAQGSGFFQSQASEDLPIRKQLWQDSAGPSANAVAVECFGRLAMLTGSAEFEAIHQGLLKTAACHASSSPWAHAYSLYAAMASLYPRTEVVIAGRRDAPETKALLETARSMRPQNSVVILRDPDDTELQDIAPFTGPMLPVSGRAAAYVCRDRACQSPVTDPDELSAMLISQKARPSGL